MGELKESGPALLERRWASLSRSVTIAASQDQVWARIADTAHWTDWYRPLSRFEPLTAATTGIGARFDEHEGPWKSTSEIVAWDESTRIGLATRTLNLPGLLTRHYREIALARDHETPQHTVVTMAGSFSFGLLGWLLVSYTYPQMHAAMYFEFRSALNGLRTACET